MSLFTTPLQELLHEVDAPLKEAFTFFLTGNVGGVGWAVDGKEGYINTIFRDQSFVEK